ncbi:hypothetical protein PSP6_490082 [Paraburkholderia tropica]|nr:hypothetical protein PSP6_490082 [Paraburkholderia tropica]
MFTFIALKNKPIPASSKKPPLPHRKHAGSVVYPATVKQSPKCYRHWKTKRLQWLMEQSSLCFTESPAFDRHDAIYSSQFGSRLSRSPSSRRKRIEYYVICYYSIRYCSPRPS